MIQMYSQVRDKKMLAEAQQMLIDAKTKIEIIRMQMLKAGQDIEPKVNTKERGRLLSCGYFAFLWGHFTTIVIRNASLCL